MPGEPDFHEENEDGQYPWTMVVKFKPTDTTCRTMVRPRRSPGARAPVSIAHFEIPLLVHALIWHMNGLPSGEVVAENVVCRPAQT